MANQVLTLANGETIPYLLEHRQRRTVGLKITADGLVVHAPKRIFAFQLNQILQEKSGWIINKLQARAANQVDAINWMNGEHLLYLGQDIQLSIVKNPSNKAPVFDANTLTLATPTPDNQTLIQRKVIQWYQKQAGLDFSRRLEIFATKLGVPIPLLTLSNAKSRWGSCNSRGEVRLNWRLLQAPPHIINYVICHELAHLKQMNHSAKFWAVVESLFPNYKLAEKELKTLSPQLHRM
ncbi:M48 family metallopeptidase [Methylotenera versatilis]|uniref:M48 family metallopeptidase n=1 Tax=Methylotenera versatilis TaxID=1055487 RepID=UPI000648F53F|nr:SprT family zinc-dependent metalloprotease [Methylotenera versatilis]